MAVFPIMISTNKYILQDVYRQHILPTMPLKMFLKYLRSLIWHVNMETFKVIENTLLHQVLFWIS